MRAVFDRLPDKGYQDNPTVDALLSYYDKKLETVATNAGNLWKLLTLANPWDSFNPLTPSSVVNLTSQQVATYSLVVLQKTTYSVQAQYSLVEQGRAHYLRITDLGKSSTVYERRFAAKGTQYYTNISLNPGTYELTSNFYSVAPIVGLRPQTEQELLQSNSLDYIAYLLGMTGRYWSKAWDVNTKIRLIRSSNDIQQWRGTEKALRLVLDAHDINYDLYGFRSGLRLSFVVNSTTTFGQKTTKTYVRLPLESNKGSREYNEALRSVDNYAAMSSNVSVSYNAFYLGYSVVGDPVFN